MGRTRSTERAMGARPGAFRITPEANSSGRMASADGRSGGTYLPGTVDGGATWSFVHAVTWDGQFSFVDDQHGWAVARNEQEIALVRTENGGVKLVDPEARHGTVVR